MNTNLRLARTFFVLAAMASASIAAETPAMACPEGSDYRLLDFWKGEWNVVESKTPDDGAMARASVSAIADGCGLYERYEQNDGLLGEAILGYDPVRKEWQQTWISNRGSMMVLRGTFKEGILTLEGDAHLKTGKVVRQRIHWQASEAGVREWAEVTKDGGTTWEEAFDVLFIRP